MRGTRLAQIIDMTATPKQLEFGVFLPIAKNGFIVSTARPAADGSFELNKRVAMLAEAVGLDFILSMAKWRGFGGPSDHWGSSLESIVLMAALAQVTTRIKIWATVHSILFHPAVVAKMMATLDHASSGRSGLNIVAGSYPNEFDQMGLWRPELDHDQRYALTREWLTVVKRLWREPHVDFAGEFFTLKDCVCEPKPLGPPRLICAGMSEVGMRFAVEEADALFVNGRDDRHLADVSRRAKDIAAGFGKTIKTFAMYIVVPGVTDSEAEARVRRYIDGVDQEAVNTMLASYGLKPDGGQNSLVLRAREGFMSGRVAGSPETLYQRINETIRAADLDGMMLIFPDYVADLEMFGRDVLPKLRESCAAPVAAEA
jgi:pyrimidine oxygenase